MSRLLNEISSYAQDLPPCKKHPIINRVGKMKVIIKKNKNMEETPIISMGETGARFVSQRAVLNALLQGRHLSQLDCKEFRVEDMRTPISHLRKQYEQTHSLRSKWILTPVEKRRIKEYWLEAKS